MRHRKKVKKLGRTASHRKAMLRNMASALFEHHQIRTTLTKAKAAQSYIENLISYGKTDTVHSRRLAFKFLQNRDLVKKLFDEIATTYSDRNGGYTRVIKLGKRRGDGADIAILQLVGFESLIIDEEAPKSSKRTKSAKSAAPAAAATEEVAEAAEEVIEEAAETAEEAVEEAAEAVEEAAADVSDKAEDVAEKAEGAVEEAAAEPEKKEAKEEKKAKPKKEAKAKTENKADADKDEKKEDAE